MNKVGFSLLVFLLTAQLAKAQDTTTIYFPFDQAQITTAAIDGIQQFVARYKSSANPPALTVYGHCDAIGTDGYNKQLSDRRVAAVVRYLQQQGIPDTLIRFKKGYGEQQPVADNTTAAGRQQNRRVEVFWNAGTVSQITTTPPPMAATRRTDSIPELSQQTIETVKEGQTLRLRNINFYGGSHRFLPQADPALNELLAVMKSNPTLIIEIHGHICCLPGSRDGFDYDANDWNLSSNRARAVYDFLQAKGIDASRMTYKGFAGRIPLIYPEQTEEDRTTNRRVEIKIIKR